jgi:hypothetical protein
MRACMYGLYACIHSMKTFPAGHFRSRFRRSGTSFAPKLWQTANLPQKARGVNTPPPDRRHTRRFLTINSKEVTCTIYRSFLSQLVVKSFFSFLDRARLHFVCLFVCLFGWLMMDLLIVRFVCLFVFRVEDSVHWTFHV